jgi:hypothetical protein
MLDHSSIALTLNTYSHVLPALHREAAGQMERLFPGPVDAPDGPVDAQNGISRHGHPGYRLRFGVPTRKMVAAAGFEPATKGL